MKRKIKIEDLGVIGVLNVEGRNLIVLNNGTNGGIITMPTNTDKFMFEIVRYLFDIVKKKIGDARLLNVLHDVIFSVGGETNLPIGNLTSQWMGNVYLNEMDHFIKENLHARAYIRYCDDFLIFGDNKKEYTLGEIREEINPSLVVSGILLTRYQERTVLTKEITELIEKTSKILQTKVFKTKIRESISIKESIICRFIICKICI